MGSVSFQLPDIGLRELHGTLSLDAEFLVFEVEDALVGEFDAERYVVKIEPKALADIRLEEGIIRDQICVRPKKRDLLAVMPGRYAEELPLTISRPASLLRLCSAACATRRLPAGPGRCPRCVEPRPRVVTPADRDAPII